MQPVAAALPGHGLGMRILEQARLPRRLDGVEPERQHRAGPARQVFLGVGTQAERVRAVEHRLERLEQHVRGRGDDPAPMPLAQPLRGRRGVGPLVVAQADRQGVLAHPLNDRGEVAGPRAREAVPGVDRDQCLDQRGVFHGQMGDDLAAHRVTDRDARLHAEGGAEQGEVVGHLRRGVAGLRRGGVAVSAHVHRDHPVLPGERGDVVDPLVGIRSQAVDEQQCRVSRTVVGVKQPHVAQVRERHKHPSVRIAVLIGARRVALPPVRVANALSFVIVIRDASRPPQE